MFSPSIAALLKFQSQYIQSFTRDISKSNFAASDQLQMVGDPAMGCVPTIAICFTPPVVLDYQLSIFGLERIPHFVGCGTKRLGHIFLRDDSPSSLSRLSYSVLAFALSAFIDVGHKTAVG